MSMDTDAADAALVISMLDKLIINKMICRGLM